MGVCVDNSSGNSVTVNTVYNTVNVIPDQNSTIVEVITPGPQGPQGPQGEAANTSSFATTGSNQFNGNQIITGSLIVTEGITGSFSGDGSGLFNIISASYSDTASFAYTASFAQTASYSTNINGLTSYIALFDTENSLSSSAIHQSNSYSIIINREFGTALNPEALFVFQPNTESINITTFESNVDNYSQINVRNESAGEFASSDIVATANNGDEFYYYINMGINSSGYAPNFIGGANDAYLYSLAKNLHIGNAAADGSHLGFFVGGDNVDVYNKLTLSPDNYHEMTGSLDVSEFIIIRKGLTVQTTGSQDVFTVSESIVRVVPQASDPVGITDAGNIWFTPTAMYIGLE
jgi:hypothetical protein